MDITDEDRKEFPYHNNDAIIGIKIIKTIQNDRLQKILGSSDDLKSLCKQISEETSSSNINHNWVLSRVAEELYQRKCIDERMMDRLTK